LKHVGAIAGRELYGLFASPVAYVVLTVWALLAGTFFLSSLISFQDQLVQAQQFSALGAMQELNLNDHLVLPFIGSMWIVLLFLTPAITMGLFANERSNGTQELLLTSPITSFEIVFGKYLAALVFSLLLSAIVAFYLGLLFFFGDPELGRTLAGMLGFVLVAASYAAVGAFASSVTRSQLIAFVLTLVLLMVIGLMLPFLVEISVGAGPESAIGAFLGYLATGDHFEQLLRGVVDTSDLAYFVLATAAFLGLARIALESARWR